LSTARRGADNPAVVADRASDAERERVLAQVSDGFVAGRLSYETFTLRREWALQARTTAELRGLVADLRRQLGLATVAGVVGRSLRSVKRRLRRWPPSLTLPSGTQRRFTIGREGACDMTLADETVSRWHASLQRGPDGWLLADLGSTNGTRLNGWRVTSPSPVRSGDRVSFGDMTFVFADRPQ
jgi:site-specific DNA-cytosine methylase